jgi:hypothetical protein
MGSRGGRRNAPGVAHHHQLSGKYTPMVEFAGLGSCITHLELDHLEEPEECAREAIEISREMPPEHAVPYRPQLPLLYHELARKTEAVKGSAAALPLAETAAKLLGDDFLSERQVYREDMREVLLNYEGLTEESCLQPDFEGYSDVKAKLAPDAT